MKEKKIGFIGLGIMGKPMAKNLLEAGYPLTVHNRNPLPVDELTTLGASKAESPKETAQKSDVIITMLPDSPDVEKVILGENGVIECAKSGTVIIDMSSIAPLVSKRIAAEIEKKGVEMLDAPVSGGETGAIQGTLAIMVGGKKEIFNKHLDILKVMGKSVVRVGDIGAGGFTKLANQIIVAINIAAISEALVLGEKAGLNPEFLYNAIRGGLAGSNVLDSKINNILKRNFKPGFKIKLHRKDLNNVLLTAKELDVPLPLTSLVQQMMVSLINEGKGEDDHSALINFIENIAKCEVKI